MYQNLPTDWSYPPALNTTFRDAYLNETMRLNNSMLDRGVEAMLVEAVRNLTLPQRLDTGFQDTGFGGQTAAIRRGDVIEFDWGGTINRTVGLNCVVCSSGAQGGAIEDACNSYTYSRNMSILMQVQNDLRPNQPYYFPSLESYFPLPDETCGLCIFTLYSISGYNGNDYSIPFPALQQPATPHKRFDTANPTGIADSSISTPTAVPTLSNPSSTGSSNKLDVATIVGVIVGVLGAVVLLALGAWLFWRKRKAKTKVVDSSSSSTADQSPADAAATRHMQLQRIQGVVRRPETNHGDIPPTYQEAVWESSLPQPVTSERCG